MYLLHYADVFFEMQNRFLLCRTQTHTIRLLLSLNEGNIFGGVVVVVGRRARSPKVLLNKILFVVLLFLLSFHKPYIRF